MRGTPVAVARAVRQRALALSLSVGFAALAAGAWDSSGDGPDVARAPLAARRAQARERRSARVWSSAPWIAPADAGYAEASDASEPWDEDAGVEPVRADLVEGLCRPLVTSLCAARARCGCGSTLGCEDSEMQRCESWLGCAYGGDASDRVVDAERAARCVALTTERHAHCVAPPPAEECYSVLVAPVGPGEACGDDDYACLGGRCFEGRCERTPRDGERCDDECAGDTFCDERGRCRAIAGLECSDPADCDGLACVGGRCGLPRGEGEPCDDDAACAPRLACESGRCARVRACERHASCLTGDECTGEHELRCVPDLPWPLGERGQWCSWESCVAGLVCRGGACTDAPALGEPCPEYSCATDLVCAGGVCVRRDQPIGAQCAGFPDRCAPGLRCHYDEEGPRCLPARGHDERCDEGPCERGLACEEVFADGRCAPVLCNADLADPWSCDVD